MPLFRPKEIIDIYSKLNINNLTDNNIKIILVDIDNTIAFPDVGSISEDAKKFLEALKNVGIKPIIFSNNTKDRVIRFVADYDIEWYYLAMKPLPFSFWSVCRKHNIKTKQCAVIGDQLLTDILGANLSGCYGIYSKQLQQHDTPLTRINRFFERLIWRYVLHEKM